MIELYIGIVLYVVSTIWLAIEGRKRNIGWLRSLLISLLLTPLIGFPVVYNSMKKISYFEIHHKCSRCGFEFTEYNEYCPLCKKEGHQIKLKQIKKEMT